MLSQSHLIFFRRIQTSRQDPRLLRSWLQVSFYWSFSFISFRVSGAMAASRNFACFAIVFYLFLFCCVSRSSPYPNTLVCCSSYSLDDAGVTKITDEGDFIPQVACCRCIRPAILDLHLRQDRIATSLHGYLIHRTLFLPLTLRAFA